MEICLKKCSAFIPSHREIYEKTLDKAEVFQESFPVIDFEEINKDIDDIRALGSEQAKEELKKHYSSITAENGMKPMFYLDKEVKIHQLKLVLVL